MMLTQIPIYLHFSRKSIFRKKENRALVSITTNMISMSYLKVLLKLLLIHIIATLDRYSSKRLDVRNSKAVLILKVL